MDTNMGWQGDGHGPNWMRLPANRLGRHEQGICAQQLPNRPAVPIIEKLQQRRTGGHHRLGSITQAMGSMMVVTTDEFGLWLARKRPEMHQNCCRVGEIASDGWWGWSQKFGLARGSCMGVMVGGFWLVICWKMAKKWPKCHRESANYRLLLRPRQRLGLDLYGRSRRGQAV